MEAGDEIELRGPIVTSRIPLSGLSEVDLVSSISHSAVHLTCRPSRSDLTKSRAVLCLDCDRDRDSPIHATPLQARLQTEPFKRELEFKLDDADIQLIPM